MPTHMRLGLIGADELDDAPSYVPHLLRMLRPQRQRVDDVLQRVARLLLQQRGQQVRKQRVQLVPRHVGHVVALQLLVRHRSQPLHACCCCSRHRALYGQRVLRQRVLGQLLLLLL